MVCGWVSGGMGVVCHRVGGVPPRHFPLETTQLPTYGGREDGKDIRVCIDHHGRQCVDRCDDSGSDPVQSQTVSQDTLNLPGREPEPIVP